MIVKCKEGCVCGRHKPKSVEHLKAISNAHKGKITSEISKNKMRLAKLGKKMSDETRLKMSAAKIGNTNTLGYKHKEDFVEKCRLRMAGNTFMVGRTLSEETKRKISESSTLAKLQHMENSPIGCKCAAHSFPNPSSLEIILYYLLKEFPDMKRQKWFGRMRVDAYLPEPYHLAFEADGEYWHTMPGRKEADVERDNMLLEKFDLPVIRFTELELRECGKQFSLSV